MPKVRYDELRDFVFLLSVFVAVGCIGKSVTSLSDPPLTPTTLVTLVASPPVSIVAIGGTQQLSATGVSATGGAVTTFDSVLYRYNTAADSLKAKVTSTGLVTGLASTVSPVLINVLGFKEGSLQADQVLVQVTATAVSGLTLSVQPVTPDSAKLAAGSAKTIIPILRNPITGSAVSNPAMKYQIKGTDVARVAVYDPVLFYFYGYQSQNVLILRPSKSISVLTNQIYALDGAGVAWIYATVNAYGTILQDSVQYTFSYPYTVTFSTVKTNLELTNIYMNQTVTLAPGATVTFQNSVAASDPLTVTYTFDNPAAATAVSPASTIGGALGNVTALMGGQTSKRQFLTSGMYHWTAMAVGGPAPWPGQTVSGTLVIK